MFLMTWKSSTAFNGHTTVSSTLNGKLGKQDDETSTLFCVQTHRSQHDILPLKLDDTLLHLRDALFLIARLLFKVLDIRLLSLSRLLC